MRTITRNEAVDAIRAKLLTLVDDSHSMCEVAARQHIFCNGFAQWTTGELRKRYGWIVANRLGVRRAELEDLANRWQLARQFVRQTPLCCDLQADGCELFSTCHGWNDFSEEELVRFHLELLGEEVRIGAEATEQPA